MKSTQLIQKAPLLAFLLWLSRKPRKGLKISLLSYKVLRGQTASYLEEPIAPDHPNREVLLYSWLLESLKVDWVEGFNSLAPLLWNQLAVQVRRLTSTPLLRLSPKPSFLRKLEVSNSPGTTDLLPHWPPQFEFYVFRITTHNQIIQMFNLFWFSRWLAPVLPLEPGPAPGVFLLKGAFSCHCCFPGVRVWLLVRCLETVPDCNTHWINKVEMNGIVRSTIPPYRSCWGSFEGGLVFLGSIILPSPFDCQFLTAQILTTCL